MADRHTPATASGIAASRDAPCSTSAHRLAHVCHGGAAHRLRDLVLCAALIGGCSWIVIDRVPPEYDGSSQPWCEPTSWPIVIDVLEVVGDSVLLGLEANAPRPDTAGMAVTALDAVLFAWSASTGVQRNNRCRAAWALYGGGGYDAAGASDRQQRAARERERLLREHPELSGKSQYTIEYERSLKEIKARRRCERHPEQCVDAGVPMTATDAGIETASPYGGVDASRDVGIDGGE